MEKATAPMPVPVRPVLSGEAGSVLVTVTAPATLPGDAGVNETDILHCWPLLSVRPVQWLVSENGPAAVIALTVTEAAAMLVTVSGWLELVVVTSWSAKVREEGEMAREEICVPEPLPVSDTVSGLP